MANQSTNVQSMADNLIVLGVVGGILSFGGIFMPWFFSGVTISGLNMGAENEMVYIIALAVPVIAAGIFLIVSRRRPDIYVALLPLFFGIVAFMLFGYVLSHTASGLRSGEEHYYQVMRLSEYGLGFFVIVIGQALSLVSALGSLMLKIALGVAADRA